MIHQQLREQVRMAEYLLSVTKVTLKSLLILNSMIRINIC